MVDIRGLSLIPRILFATDGAITHILEAYAGEDVDFVRLASALIAEGDERRPLGIADGERALRRISLLRGRASGRVFVHADAVVMVDRLPGPVADELLDSGDSLLNLLAQNRIGTFRETVAEWEGRDEEIAAHFGAAPDEIHVARTYQVVLDERPVAWITESFPKAGFPDRDLEAPSPRDGRLRDHA
jgi:chorismate--pyruvate lyase